MSVFPSIRSFMNHHHRRQTVRRGKKTVRSEYVNELYYARDNNPNFYQFKSWHFTDEYGRMYKIASDEDKVFENERFAHPNSRPWYKTTSLNKKRKKCVVNADGFIKLFVKLSSPTVKWFSSLSINRSIELHEKDSDRTIIVKLRGVFKYNEKRRTGTIYVSNVNKSYMNDLLNE